MKELIFQKEMILIKQVHQKDLCFVIIGILKILVINFNQIFVINVLKNIERLNAKGVDYRWILWSISRNEAVNILNNSVLEDKGVL